MKVHVERYEAVSGVGRITVPPQTVVSSNIRQLAYSSYRDVLFVIYKSQSQFLYQYPNASNMFGGSATQLIERMEKSESIGGYINQYFRNSGAHFDKFDLDEMEAQFLKGIMNRTIEWFGSSYAEGKALLVALPRFWTPWSEL